MTTIGHDLTPLEHGGGLRAAARRYGTPAEGWLDLSTGINPNGWPLPHAIDPKLWQRLPEREDGLEEAAAECYGLPHPPLPLAGSQAAIQALARLRPTGETACLAPLYGEHPHAWLQSGHPLHLPTTVAEVERLLDRLDTLVVVNPNNPTGGALEPDQLLAWADHLSRRNGVLVVDEAFMDATPERSVAPHAHRRGLVVLRSLGKFFGLAGARVGFAAGDSEIITRLAHHLGPWTVSGPARHIAHQALEDRAWQASTRPKLHAASQRLATLLTSTGLHPDGGTALFQWLRSDAARGIQERLARQGILVRAFDAPSSLRFGLPPGHDAAWHRLEKALREHA
ncbi:MAG: threonine-phosphate decarboxylase [Magnetococcales bacterium]|nr:threonine-phosphate decarboxylase [Magnetococcales bacterium]